MTDTDLDIILAIADGRLTGQAKQDALARIASDPELGDALASQIAAMDELKSLEPALMTPSERAALRSALVEQLNLQPVAPLVEMEKRRRAWWQPVLGLASAAALLVAIVVVPSMLSGSDDSSAELAAIAPSATTSADDSAEIDAGGSGPATPTETVVVPSIAAEEAQDFFSSAPLLDATTVSTITDARTESVDDGADAADEGADSAAETAPEITLESVEPSASADVIAIDAARISACLSGLSDLLPDGSELIPGAATLNDGRITVHFGVNDGGRVAYSVSVVLDTCTIAP